MDTDEPRTPKLADMASKRLTSGSALGGDMSLKQHASKQPKLTEASASGNGDFGHNKKKMIPADPKMFSCANCGKEFGSRRALGGHRSRGRCQPHVTALKVNDVQGSENVTGLSLKETRKYYCKNCGECCHTFQRLGWHRSKCKSLVQSRIEKFYCKHCGKDFPTLRSASSHMGKCKGKEAAHTSARHVLQDPDQEDSS